METQIAESDVRLAAAEAALAQFHQNRREAATRENAKNVRPQRVRTAKKPNAERIAVRPQSRRHACKHVCSRV